MFRDREAKHDTISKIEEREEYKDIHMISCHPTYTLATISAM